MGLVSSVRERNVREETENFHRNQIALTVDYIHNNLHRKLTVEELADKAIMSIFHFQRVFKNHTGYGVREYIRNELLDGAAKDLRETDIKVKNIQEKAHYDSPEVFSRAFKTRFGVSPSLYREQESAYQEVAILLKDVYQEENLV